MNIIEIIEKKRDKKELSKEEIEYFINGYTKGEIADYQAAALLMAIYLNDMTGEECTNLTLAMANSGEMLDFSKMGKIVVDKHSTGGVGDKVSLILLPLVSSCGVMVAKMSGRGLGFTGGTADKLEAIPGYNTGISMEEFRKNISEIGISMITQTLNVAPADKKIYSLRDSIGCVENISLIASSIMSKKIASGADKIVLDVTVGKGAFMKDIESAKKLSEKMIEIGKLANRETVCILTNMDEPLGKSVGNSLEVIEAIEFLKGNMEEDVKQVVLALGAYMIKLSGLGNNIEENKKMMLEKIENGKAFNKLCELVKKQSGDVSYIENIEKFRKAKYIQKVEAKESGTIYEIDAKEIGKSANYLGAGRTKKEDEINNAVGIVLEKKIGSKVEKGDILAYIYADEENKAQEIKLRLENIIKIDTNGKDIKKIDHILDII